MALAQQDLINEYIADGVLTTFPYTFKIVDHGQLSVLIDGIPTGSGFDIDMDSNTIIFPDPPLVGTIIRIFRSTPIIRTTDFTNNGVLNADTLDHDLDYLTAICQENTEYNIKLNSSGDFDASNNKIANVGTPDDNYDAANKLYVDSILTSSGNLAPPRLQDDGKFLRALEGAANWQGLTQNDILTPLGYTPLNKAGDTINGHLTLPATAISNANHATQKYYVDNAITTAVNNAIANLTTTIATGEEKHFIKPTKAANGMVIVVNNQIFMSGVGANYVGQNGGVTRGLVWLPFNNSHQIPPGTTIVDVASNGSSVLAVLSNGWVYSYGYNSHGQLGQGNTTRVFNLKRIEWFVSNNISIDKVWMNSEQYTGGASYGVSFFRGTNGGLYGCGHNGYGTLGIGNTTATISTPTQVLNITNVVDLQVSCAANGHCLAVSSNDLKAVWHWGGNNHGQGGRGNTTNQHTPAIVYTDSTHNIQKIIAVSSNYYNGTAWSGEVSSSYILAGGVIRSCGYNGYGQLGVGNTTQQNSWQIVAGTDWTDIEASGGYFTSLYASQNGTLFSCGYNGYGQLGSGNTTNRSSLATTGLADVRKIHAVQYSSYGAVICEKNDGTLWGCGYNGSGILLLSTGATTPITSFTPLAIPIHSPIKEVRLLVGTYNRYDMSLFILLENNTLYSAGANDGFILSNQDITNGLNNSALSVVQFIYK